MNLLFISLGCDKNLVDTEKMLGILGKEGYSFVDDENEADIVVVNTCCCKRITYFCRIVVCVCEVDGWILPISTYWEFVRRVIVAGCESIIIAQRNGTINSDVFSA